MEEALIASIMLTETQHDPLCVGCRSCDDTPRESCHQLCSRSEAIRRLARRTLNGTYTVRATDRKIYERELKRWPQATLQARADELRFPQAA